MSVLAVRVGRLPDPTPTSLTTCWRCGVRFNFHLEHVTRNAPCRDCRKTLRDEGDMTDWRSNAARKRENR